MNLRAQLKITNMSKGESIHEYLTRVSRFKEQLLEAIEDKIDEIELVMTALNGLTRPWDSFIQTIYGGRKAYNLMSYGKNVFKRKLEYLT